MADRLPAGYCYKDLERKVTGQPLPKGEVGRCIRGNCPNAPVAERDKVFIAGAGSKEEREGREQTVLKVNRFRIQQCRRK